MGLVVVSSSRASNWPSFTAMPSSINTSATLPVTFDETVAWRRATTYPDALSTARAPPRPPRPGRMRAGGGAPPPARGGLPGSCCFHLDGLVAKQCIQADGDGQYQ